MSTLVCVYASCAMRELDSGCPLKHSRNMAPFMGLSKKRLHQTPGFDTSMDFNNTDSVPNSRSKHLVVWICLLLLVCVHPVPCVN